MAEADENQDENLEGTSPEQDPDAPAEPAESGEAAEDYAPLQLDEQLGEGGDESGVEEALQAWAEGGHGDVDADDADEVKLVHLPQLEAGISQPKNRPRRLNNVMVHVTVELGRRTMTVREIAALKEQEVVEIEKLAGESFDIRVNGRLFAQGEVVVVTDEMAVRITSLVEGGAPRDPDSE